MKKRTKYVLLIIFVIILVILELLNLICNTIYTNKDNIEYNHNAESKLYLKSAYGDIQAFHPKVISFKKKWHGYKYWMTFSPYPYGISYYENPHIKASNDLINWEEPIGLINPIEDTPDNYLINKIYNSDPHLVYNNDKDIIELYWRYVNDIDDIVIIYRKTSKDGINWSKKEEILKSKRSEKDYLSPSILYLYGIYRLWYVDKDKNVKYTRSFDGYNYEEEKIIELTYPIESLKTWHIDVIKTEKGYEMLTVAFNTSEEIKSMNLYYFYSRNNNWLPGKIILRPSISSWDNSGIYRSSFIYENGKYYVFYSGISTDNTRGIGLTIGEDIENLKGIK